MCKFRTLKANEIDVRVDQCFKTEKWQGVRLLLYKDARVDMSILDESVGTLNWQRSHEVVNGNLYCKVSIYDKDKGEWISKSDCGVESNTDKEKGQSSDSFKRACVNWGIGRELYSAPKNILARCDVDECIENGKKRLRVKDKRLRWKVEEISYDENKEINHLVIREMKYEGEGDIVYTFDKDKGGNAPKSNEKTKSEKSIEPKKKSEPKPIGTLEWAKTITITLTNGKVVPVDRLSDASIERLLETDSEDYSDARIAGKMILELRHPEYGYAKEEDFHPSEE